jgi:type II secretory pathway component GspD/PulD (secretin)
LIKVFNERDGIDVLTAPRMTTLSNRGAEISVSEDRTVIDGPTLRVMANMSPASSNLIELVADASIVQMLGYELDSKGISQPLILTNRASGRERIWDGQSVLMDAGAVTHRVHFVDKVPYLGDLPLVGRFFRNEGTQDQVSRLFVLVTPTLIDAVGRPIHDPAHPPFDPATFPPNP